MKIARKLNQTVFIGDNLVTVVGIEENLVVLDIDGNIADPLNRGESLQVGRSTITLLRAGGHSTVHLGIMAPAEVKILRGELLDREPNPYSSRKDQPERQD